MYIINGKGVKNKIYQRHILGNKRTYIYIYIYLLYNNNITKRYITVYTVRIIKYNHSKMCPVLSVRQMSSL